MAHRAFGVVTEPAIRRRLLYLLLRFPLGVLYFVLFVSWIAVGLALLPLLVGVPLLAGALGAASYVGALEALLARRLLDRDVSYEPADPNKLPLIPYLKAAATDPRNYALLAYALVSFAVGLAAFVFLATATAVSVALVLAPALFSLPFASYRFGAALPGLGRAIDTVPEALLACALGVLVALASSALAALAARLLGDLVVALLGDSASEGESAVTGGR